MLSIISLLLLAVTFGITNVEAQTFSDKFIEAEWIPGVWVNKYKDGHLKWQQIKAIRRSSDNMLVYCAEPWQTMMNGVYTGTTENPDGILKISKEQWKRVSLIAFYGYGYGNHTDLKWYAITQVMIWRAVDPATDTYFTDGLNGARWDSRFTSEIAEIEQLIKQHYLSPNFGEHSFQAVIGQPLVLTDANSLLSKYDVLTNENVSISKTNNTLTIIPTKVGSTTLVLENADKTLATLPIIYTDPVAQDILAKGKYDPLTFSIELDVIGGQVTINKMDKDTLKCEPQGDAVLSGATYGVYKEDGTLVTQIVTLEDGTATSIPLPFIGRGYVQEISPSEGYRLDTTKYYFEINSDNLYPSIDVYEDVIERKVNIFKMYGSNETGFIAEEPNVQFDIYLKSTNELVATIITNENGKASVTLPYGTYRVTQVTTTKNYYKVDDFDITIDEDSEEDIDILLTDAPITAKLKVVKIDAETQKVIKRANIPFRIFSVDKNEYVCQTITYPTAEEVCIFKTDQNGTLITPLPLIAGTYRLEEVDQAIDGYLWNKQSQEFTINDESEFVEDSGYGIIFEVTFENKPVKGEVEVTKLGEKLVIENNAYRYEEIKLDGVVYELYANEDIYSADGTLVYSSGDLISTNDTKDGYFKISNLHLGSYCFVEKSTTENHILDSTKHCFELKYEDQYTPIVSLSLTFKNYLGKGALDFTKTDLVTGEPLPNTKVQIFTNNENGSKDELIFEGVTDENGKIAITDLFVGKFYLLESEAPDNYILNPEKMEFEITEDGAIVKANMTNEQIVEIPNTGISDSKVLNVVGLIFIIAGVGYIIYDKKKKK